MGNFYDSYWEEGASDSLIRSLSQEYEWNLMTLENDVFRGEASAFREAVNKVLGYDGVQINFPNGEKHFVAWFPEQIKSATDNVGTFSGNPDIRWREVDERKAAAEEDALDRRFEELYERYESGDKSAYGEAEELAAEAARRKGYDVKVYHGTGADGFNVADATSR